MHNFTKDIIDELLSYLNLEFGNNYPEESLSLEDLRYTGSEEVNGGVSHCWDVSSLKNDLCALIFVSADGNLTYSIKESPHTKNIYEFLFLEIEGPGGIKKKLPFQEMPEFKVSHTGMNEVIFDKDKVVEISSEICFTPNPPQVRIRLLYEKMSYSCQSGLGVITAFSLGNHHTIYLEVGDLDGYWN